MKVVMRLVRSLYRTTLLTVLTAGVLSGQTVTGRLVEQGTDQPINGAFVVLVDNTGHEVLRVLTDASGRFVLQAPGRGRYTLRAARIGYRSTTSPVIELGGGETLEYRLAIPLEPIELSGIDVELEPRCVMRPDEGIRTARVWEEARKALEGTRWTARQARLSYEILRYRRELDPQTLVVRSEESESGWRRAAEPFTTPAAESLMEKGFVQFSEEGPAYYAPDEEVLLSDVFLDNHCFRVRLGKSEGAGHIGLAFEPVAGRDVPDVSGVLWLDERTAELRYIEYRYTGLDLPVLTDVFGGKLEFERQPTGTWIIKRWWIRGPMLGSQRAWWSRGEKQHFLAAIREEGGEVTRIEDLTDPAAGTVVGVVFDSTRMRPLARAKVYLSGTVHFDTTDSSGAFRIEEVPPGEYTVAFSHPRIHSLEYYRTSRPAAVERESATRVHLSIPTMMRVRAERLARFSQRLARISEPDSLRALEARLGGAEAGGPDTLMRRGLVTLRLYELTGRRGDFERARRTFRQTVERYPDIAWAHFGLGLSLARGPEVRIPGSGGYRQRVVHVGSLAEIHARASLLEALELDPALADAALELAALGLATRAPGTLDAARGGLVEAINAGARHPDLLLALSDVEAAAGNLPAAEEAARSALALGADTASALHALAVALLVQEDRAELGADAYLTGVDQLTPTAVERYLEDVLPIVKENEEAEWRTADLGARRDWLRKFWALRAAVAGVTVPERLAEHYRRLALAHQRYRRLGTRGAPPGGAVSRAMLIGSRHRRLPFDDRGLIFVRHGEPEEIIRTAAQKIPPNETWVYATPDPGYRLFHFFKLEGRPDFVLAAELPRCDPLYYKYGDSGRLSQQMHRSQTYGSFTNNELQPLVDYYEDRARYDPRFQLFVLRCISATVGADRRKSTQDSSLGRASSDLAGLDTVAANLYGSQLSAEVRRVAARALERETHRPAFDSDLPFMYQFYTFRGENGLTDATAALLIPGEQLEARIKDNRAVYSLSISFILLDTLRNRVARTDTLYHYRAPLPLAPGEYLRTQVEVSAEASDSALYRVVVRNASVPGTGQLYGSSAVIRDYSGPSLMLSDIVMAEAEGGPWRRGTIELALRPRHWFRVGQPFTLFYEIYNLPPEAPYRTEITIAPAKLRRGDAPAPTLRFDGLTGAIDRAGVQEVRRISTDLVAGSYLLRVAVTNLQTGESTTRDTEFHIRE